MRRLLVEAVEFVFQLRSGQGQRSGQLGAGFAQIVSLFAASAGQLSFDRIADFIESLSQAIGYTIAKIPFSALQPGGHIDSGVIELLAQGLVQHRRLFGKIRDFSGLRRT